MTTTTVTHAWHDSKHYYRDGKSYDRVTTVLQSLRGMGDPASAAARMLATGLQVAASELSMGSVPPGYPAEHLGGFQDYIATSEGADWVRGRYYSELGRAADQGTLVDSAFNLITGGQVFDMQDATDWVMSEVEAWNAQREITRREWQNAKDMGLVDRVLELEGQPRYPFYPDVRGIAARVQALSEWWGQSGLVALATQETLYCENDRVAGTFDLIAEDKSGRRHLVDLKTSKQTSLTHAAQVWKYRDMLHRGEDVGLAVVYARYDEKTERARIYWNAVGDEGRAAQLWAAALHLHRFDEKGLFARAKAYTPEGI